MTNNPFEIPHQIRDLAERSVEQARTAYGQFMDAMLKTQSASLTSVPATAMSTSFSNIQERAINFARQNFEASFSLATDLARAKDIAAGWTCRSALPSRKCRPTQCRRRSSEG